jgi:hypothetical protein
MNSFVSIIMVIIGFFVVAVGIYNLSQRSSSTLDYAFNGSAVGCGLALAMYAWAKFNIGSPVAPPAAIADVVKAATAPAAVDPATGVPTSNPFLKGGFRGILKSLGLIGKKRR